MVSSLVVMHLSAVPPPEQRGDKAEATHRPQMRRAHSSHFQWRRARLGITEIQTEDQIEIRIHLQTRTQTRCSALCACSRQRGGGGLR